MASITPEMIRDISVKAVEDFLNNKVPLNVGLAKQAAAHELNEEQVKRAVESTNNIAYLKILQMSEDRTVEFPLAKYAEVMREATLPEDFQEKAAAAIGAQPSASIEKTASAQDSQERELVRGEKLTYFIKAAAANKEALERLQIESMNVAERLVKVAKEIGKDEKWMDKLACVTDEQNFKELSVLVSGSVQKYRDLADVGLFKEAQLRDVTGFSNLYKQAREMVREQRERAELQKQADATTQGVNQNNFSQTMKNVSKNSAEFAKNVTNPGYVAGRVAGTVAAVPFRAVHAAGKAVNNSVKNTFDKLRQGGDSTVVAGGKAAGKTSASIVKGVFRAGANGLDAAFYDPGVDESTGRSKDVWNALQRD